MKTQQQYHSLPPFPAPRCSVSGALFGIIAFILIAARLAKRFGWRVKLPAPAA